MVAIVIAVGTGGHASSPGCIDFSFAYSVGGQEVYRCGPAARRTCTSASSSYSGQTLAAVRRACRTAGYASS